MSAALHLTHPKIGYSVTVSDVLRLALPPGSAVLVGQHQLDKSVFWARLLGPRNAVFGASEAGEMVLLPHGASHGRGFAQLVQDLSGAGVEAFVVSGEPAADGLRVAESIGTPVLGLAANASLVEAERSIISLIVDREAQLRRKVEQIYERLLTTLVDDAGIGALAAEVGAVTGGRVVVLDEYFRVQVAWPADAPTEALGQRLGSILAARDPSSVRSRWASPFRQAHAPSAPQAFVVPLQLRGTPAGYLALAGDADVSELDRQVAERAGRVLGLELAKQRAVTEARLRSQGDFLDDLLLGNYPSEEAMQARARWLGHDLARPYVVLAVAVDDADGGPGAASQRLRSADLVKTEVVRLTPRALVREQKGTLALAMPREAVPSRAEAIELAENLRAQLSELIEPARVTVGVGRVHPGVGGLARAYTEADQALAIGRALFGGAHTVHFENLGVQRLLFQLRDNQELASFYDDMVGRLQAHDERQSAELVNTLEAFFECHGNHVRTAQRLHLHRNTLLYRLERARQVLAVDLDDPEIRLALQVALKIGRVIGRRPLDGAGARRS